MRWAGIPLPFGVVVLPQFAAIALFGGPIPHRNELAFLSSLCAVRGGLGYVVLCKLLSGSGYRLRATSTIGERTRDRRLLPKSAISLAEACRAGTSDGWCPGPRGRSSGFTGRHNRRDMPGGIRETRRRVDRTRRALAALDFAAKEVAGRAVREMKRAGTGSLRAIRSHSSALPPCAGEDVQRQVQGREQSRVSRFARPASTLRRTKTAATTPSSVANLPWVGFMKNAARPRVSSGSGRSPAFLACRRTCRWMATRRRSNRHGHSSARAGASGWPGQSWPRSRARDLPSREARRQHACAARAG